MKYRYVFSLLLVFVFFNSSYLVNAMEDDNDNVNNPIPDDINEVLKNWLEANKNSFQIHNHNEVQTIVGDGAFVLPTTPVIEQALKEYLEANKQTLQDNHLWMTYFKQGVSQGISGVMTKGLGLPIGTGIINGFISVKRLVEKGIWGPTIEEQLNNYAQEGAVFNTEAIVFAQVYNQMPPDERLEKMKDHIYTMIERRLDELSDIMASSRHKKTKPTSDESPQQKFNEQLAEKRKNKERQENSSETIDDDDVNDDKYRKLASKLEERVVAEPQG